ncbi:hypothetical protein ACFQV2_03445 [Actinokineospora soli]|uniref:Uncharacterized protein n=1 Tax=Actinokineospora soli TaxID=1048753 RepID=A0ABW2THY1_9PSEU
MWTLLIIAVIAWTVFVQVQARRQLDVLVPLSEKAAAEAVTSLFGVTWSQVEGRGHLNFKPRLRRHAPTLSISFEPEGTGKCQVSIWTSAWKTQYGVMAHAQLAWRKKRSVANRIQQVPTQPQQWSRGT